jgi:hypothetical protein
VRLRDDALEAALAHRVEEGSSVVKRHRCRPRRAVEGKLLEPPAPRRVRLREQRFAVDGEDVEDHQRDRDRAVVVEDSSRQEREVRVAAVVEGDEFAVEHEPGAGRSASSGTLAVMVQPRRLRIRNRSSVETRARKPSHFTSNDQPLPVGSLPVRGRASAWREAALLKI